MWCWRWLSMCWMKEGWIEDAAKREGINRRPVPGSPLEAAQKTIRKIEDWRGNMAKTESKLDKRRRWRKEALESTTSITKRIGGQFCEGKIRLLEICRQGRGNEWIIFEDVEKRSYQFCKKKFSCQFGKTRKRMHNSFAWIVAAPHTLDDGLESRRRKKI